MQITREDCEHARESTLDFTSVSQSVSQSVSRAPEGTMSFAALRDKRAARREPSASVSKPTPVHDQIQQRPLTTPITAYSDFPNDLLEIRTSATLGRSVYATPSATAEALRRGESLDHSGDAADTAQGARFSALLQRRPFYRGQHSTNTVQLVFWESTN